MIGHRPGRAAGAAALAGALLFTLAAPARPARAADRSGDMTQGTRVLAWTGGDHLGVAIAADVRYQPGADARVVISGPRREIADIVVEHGDIRHGAQNVWRWWRWWDWDGARRVRILVVAPRLSAASLSGAGRLDLGRRR